MASKPRPRREGAATAERILDAAERLFAEHGYEATSLRRVAAEVGVQNPSIYNHFASKAALYDAVLERAIAPVIGELWDSEDDIDATLRHLGNHPDFCRLLLNETLAGGDRLSPSVREWMGAVVSKASDWLSTAPGAGRWDDVGLALAVLALYHVAACFNASGDLIAALTGRALDDDRTFAAQKDIVTRISVALFGPDEQAAAHGEGGA